MSFFLCTFKSNLLRYWYCDTFQFTPIETRLSTFSSTSLTGYTALNFHPFWFLGHYLAHKLLHCNLAKVLLFFLGMQVQWTIYCLKSPFLDQILLMHHQQDFFVLHIIPLVYIRVVVDLLYSISHKNFKSFCGAPDICQHHLTICPKPFCNVPKTLFFPY